MTWYRDIEVAEEYICNRRSRILSILMLSLLLYCQKVPVVVLSVCMYDCIWYIYWSNDKWLLVERQMAECCVLLRDTVGRMLCFNTRYSWWQMAEQTKNSTYVVSFESTYVTILLFDFWKKSLYLRNVGFWWSLWFENDDVEC